MMSSFLFRQALLQLLIILFLLLFPHYVPLPFYSYAVVCMLVVLWYLKRHQKNLRDLGLQKSGLSVSVLLTGITSALLWVAFNKWVYHPVITHLFNVPDYTEYDFIRKKVSHLITAVLAAWIVGSFYEEIAFRGFIQKTFEGWFQSRQQAFWLAGLCTSTLFGLYHWQQGIFGMTAAFLGGLLWTFLLRRYRGNLWYPMFSHAFFDTVALLLIYFHITL